jgi:hypothetical protein
VIRGNWIKTCLYIGEVLQEQFCHVGVDVLSALHRCVGMSVASDLRIFSFAHGVDELAKHETVAHVPGYAGKLRCTIDCSRYSLTELRRHRTFSLNVANCSTRTIDRDHLWLHNRYSWGMHARTITIEN